MGRKKKPLRDNRDRHPVSVAALDLLRAHLPGLRAALAPEERARPLGHLQLGRRASRATAALETIGDLLHLLGAEDDFPAHWTPAARAETAAALELLATSRRPNGRIDWTAFLRERPPTFDRGMYYFHPAFERLGEAERNLGPATLGLRNKTLNSLGAAHIHTIADLLRGAEAGLHLPSAHVRTFGRVARTLEALGAAIRKDGTIDWPRYAGERHRPIFPEETIDPRDTSRVLALLPEVTRQVVLHDRGEKAWKLLEQRHFVPRPARKTLEELGSRIGRVKERVRQIEKKTLTLLRGILLADEYAHSTCRVRKSFTKGVRTLARQLGPEQPGPMEPKEWKALVASHWGAAAAETPGARFYLPLILGREIKPQPRLSFAERALREARLFIARHGKGVTPAELCAHLAATFPNQPDEEVDLARIVRLGGPFFLQQGRYFRRPTLARRADRCSAMLRSSGHPVHRNDLLRRHNARWPDDPCSEASQLIAAMQADEERRFARVGRSGLWGMTAWKGIEWGTVEEVAQHILERKGPLTLRSLLRRVTARRPVTRSGLRTILRTSAAFRRTRDRLWTVK